MLVKVQWTASTPLDLHQNDGGLLVTHPQILGDGLAGTVVEAGPDVKRLKAGDQVKNPRSPSDTLAAQTEKEDATFTKSK